MKYERKVHGYFGEWFGPLSSGGLYAPAQWIEFGNGSNHSRWAQPDGLLVDFNRGLLTVVEIKLRHMQKAWWWLRELYLPLITFLFGPSWSYSVLEVVRFYDPSVTWPEPIRMVKSPDLLRNGQFGVHIWNGNAR